MEARSGDTTKIYFVFDSLPTALPIPTNTNSKNNKIMVVVYPLKLCCWHLPSTGGLAYFPTDRPPSPPSMVSPDLSPDTKGRRRRSRTHRPRRILNFPLACWQQQLQQLLPPMERQQPQAGSLSGLTPPFPGCLCLIRIRKEFMTEVAIRTSGHPRGQ